MNINEQEEEKLNSSKQKEVSLWNINNSVEGINYVIVNGIKMTVEKFKKRKEVVKNG